MGEPRLLSCFRTANVKSNDGFARGDRFRDFHELVSAVDSFNVQSDDFRVGTGTQIFQAVHNIDAGFVAHT